MNRKHQFSYNLCKRQSSDNVTGSFSFSITLITSDFNERKTKKNNSNKCLVSTTGQQTPTKNNNSQLSECFSPNTSQSPVTPAADSITVSNHKVVPQSSITNDTNTYQAKEKKKVLVESSSNRSMTNNLEPNISKVNTNSLPSCFNKYNIPVNCSQNVFNQLVIQENQRNSGNFMDRKITISFNIELFFIISIFKYFFIGFGSISIFDKL